MIPHALDENPNRGETERSFGFLFGREVLLGSAIEFQYFCLQEQEQKRESKMMDSDFRNYTLVARSLLVRLL